MSTYDIAQWIYGLQLYAVPRNLSQEFILKCAQNILDTRLSPSEVIPPDEFYSNGIWIYDMLFPHLLELYVLHPPSAAPAPRRSRTTLHKKFNQSPRAKQKAIVFEQFSQWYVRTKPSVPKMKHWLKQYECSYSEDCFEPSCCIRHPELLDQYSSLRPEFLLRCMQFGQSKLTGHSLHDVQHIIDEFLRLYGLLWKHYRLNFKHTLSDLPDVLRDLVVMYVL